MIKLFAILLIITGSFLEVWYYAYRFTNDGIETWLAIVIGITLTLLLCIAVLKRNNKGVRFLIFTLIIYSILATSAGQSFSLSLFQKEEIQEDVQEEYRQDEIQEIKNRLLQIDEKYSQIQSGINETTQTLHDRGVYRTALEKAENQQLLLNEERSQLQDRLIELRQEAITYRKTNIYEFYNRLTFMPEDWLQFFFQTWLSIFIAIMAPLGITTLQAEKPKPEKKMEPDQAWIKLIENWVHVNWFGVRSKKSSNILNETNFFEYTKTHDGKEFPKKYYNKIKAIAIKTRCINNSGTIINNNEPEVIGRIVNYLLKVG
ncbi:hypothetical protein LCGC14_1551830, partial [marine sediment metagenome]